MYCYSDGEEAYHLSLSRVIEALQQLDWGALSTATLANQGQRLACLHRHIQTLQDPHIRPRGIGKVDAAEINVPCEVCLEKKKKQAEKTFRKNIKEASNI